MNKVFGLIALAGIAAAASAQTGTYTWEVSVDNGTTWSNDVTSAAGATVKVRLSAAWAGVNGTDLGYAGGQFDGKVAGGAGDTIANIVRPAPFAFAAQTLAATTIGSDLKIDTAADVAGFGAGTGWVNPGQAAKDFAAAGTYNSNNPAVVFTFDITLGAGSADRICGMVLNAATGRAMAVYNSSAGGQTRINAAAVTVSNATIHVPTPGSLALLGLGGLVAGRRRR